MTIAARKIAVAGMNFGGAPGGILLFVGPVGPDIAKLELRYQNGPRREHSAEPRLGAL